MVAKRKTVSKLASALNVTKASLAENVEEDADAQIVPFEEEKKELSEQDLVATRTKELKSMSAEQLKEVVLSCGLATGKKEDMIKTMLKHDAKARAAAREQKTKIRAVVIKKKQELESLSTAELNKLCDGSGIKGLRSKEERVQRLLIQWQENDGVDKALAQIAQDERQKELDALDSTKLQKMCTKIGVDPFVKEIMVERISKRENEKGCYSRPTLVQEREVPAGERKGDMVETLLANEAQRQKEKELKIQQEDVAAQKRKELKSMSVEDLKKGLAKRGLEASGKKDDMVETLFIVAVQEDAVAARQADLKSKSLQELKELLSRYSLETGTKENMIRTMLAHEAKCRQELQAYEVKVSEAAAQKKNELETQTNATLKELCLSKGLAVGGGKEDRIERLVDEIQRDGDLDTVVSRNLRNARKDELMSMDKPVVVKLCEQLSINPVVKDIMVERIMMHESEGETAIAMTDVEPPTKRARVSKK